MPVLSETSDYAGTALADVPATQAIRNSCAACRPAHRRLAAQADLPTARAGEQDHPRQLDRFTEDSGEVRTHTSMMRNPGRYSPRIHHMKPR